MSSFAKKVDLKTLAGGINTYAYVGVNPISRIDPLGLLDRLVFNGTTLTGYDDMDVEFQASAVAGPWGRGHLPEETYNGSNLRRRKDNKALMCNLMRFVISFENSADETLSAALGRIFAYNPNAIEESIREFPAAERKIIARSIRAG